MMKLLSVIALVALIGTAWAQTTLITTGAPTINPLISNFIFSFRSVNPAVSLQFAGTVTTTNQQARAATLIGPGLNTADFAMSNNPYTTDEQVLFRVPFAVLLVRCP
jgi:hypothetical protein